MKYPTIDEVEKASHYQICEWCRFLPSPGWAAVGTEHFEETLREEGLVLKYILERFSFFGGWTPKLSKKVGWEKR